MALIVVVVGRAPSLGARGDASVALVNAERIDAPPRHPGDRGMSRLEAQKLLVAVLFLLENKSSAR
jgi:hypothetical protein